MYGQRFWDPLPLPPRKVMVLPPARPAGLGGGVVADAPAAWVEKMEVEFA